ncbi:hypothetical protein K1719_006484 [Acacia pycnantha]|nr:hypothetical protein K1719_006484 [Acacia pycnantha]
MLNPAAGLRFELRLIQRSVVLPLFFSLICSFSCHFDWVMKTFQIEVKKKHRYYTREPTWITPKTRRQPEKSNLCGHYA